MEKFLKLRHPIERCNIIQSMHDWQNTGYQKSRFSQSCHPLKLSSSDCDNPSSNVETGQCYFECGNIETPFHYMQCTSEILSKARSVGKEVLKKALIKMHTAPSLQEAILNGIYFWEDGTEYELDADSNKFLFDEAHTLLFESQQKIGWDKFLKGYVSKDWGYIQEQYYSHTQTVSGKKIHSE
jgi:hypothetical protein